MNNLKSILFYIVLSIMAMSCSKDMLMPYGTDFELSGGDVRVSGSGVSWNTFSSKVVGSGWECIATKQILDDGSLSNDSYWPRDGGGPAAYYIDESEITKYYEVMAYLSDPYRSSITPYKYEDSTIIPARGEKMVVVKVSGDKFSCVESLGYAFMGKDNDPKPIYGYSTYKRMSSKQLSEYRERHSDK